MRNQSTTAFLMLIASCSSNTSLDSVGCNWTGTGDLQGYSINAYADIAGNQLRTLRLFSTSGLAADRTPGTCSLDVLKSTDAKISKGIDSPPRELRIESSTGQDFADMSYSINNNRLSISPVIQGCAPLPKLIELKSDPSACAVQW
jgi:hypothetical protein